MAFLGEGSFGYVTTVQNNPKLAVKTYKTDNKENTYGLEYDYVREIDFLTTFHHPHIIECNSFTQNNQSCKLYMPRMKTDIWNWLERNTPSEDLCLKWFCEALDVLCALHEKEFFHRDIKPENMLLDSKKLLYFCDFGCITSCQRQNPAFTHPVCTLWYRPLEVFFKKDRYTSALDVWSLGASFIEIITGKTWIMGDKESDQIRKICFWTGTPSATDFEAFGLRSYEEFDSFLSDVPKFIYKQQIRKHLSSYIKQNTKLIDVLEGMLKPNPTERLTAADALLKLNPNYVRTPLLQKPIVVGRPKVFTYHRQNSLTNEHRRILVEYMFETTVSFNFTLNVYFCAVNLVDRYLSVKEATKENFQLIGCSSLLLASKIYETKSFTPENLVYASDYAFLLSHILDMEVEIFSTLGGQISLFSLESISCLNKSFHSDDIKKLLCKYFFVLASNCFHIWHKRNSVFQSILLLVKNFYIVYEVPCININFKNIKKNCNRYVCKFLKNEHESNRSLVIKNFFSKKHKFFSDLQFI